METGDVKIELIENPATVYLGITDVKNSANVKNGHMVHIDYVIRHQNSYKSNGRYGSYGGFDLILLHLKEAAPAEFKPVCLPRSNYTDSGIGPTYGAARITIAGYGTFTRKECKTDEYGASKHHFCAKNKKPCNEIGIPPQSDECNAIAKHFKTSIPQTIEEVLLKDIKSGDVHGCYRPESPKPGSRGWCRTNKDASIIGKIKQSNSWGFCSSECFLNHDKNENITKGIFRTKQDVDVLDDKFCRQFLESSLDEKTVKHMPQILCIGYIKALKFETWKKELTGEFKPAPELANLTHNLTIATGMYTV